MFLELFQEELVPQGFKEIIFSPHNLLVDAAIELRDLGFQRFYILIS